MIGYLFLLQLNFVAITHARPPFTDDVFDAIYFNNDANLNPGFDLDAFRVDQLKLHNHYRKLHGVPRMTMDLTLTRQAQSYAENLASKAGELKHCEQPTCNRRGAGENLARAWGAVDIETNATKAWYEEIWDYNYCHGENTRNMHRPGHEGKPIGHFTQVVWRNSVKLGIGYARTADKTGVYVVGRYRAHGNVPRQYNRQVTKPAFLLNALQNNCRGISGRFSRWSSPGTCTQSCGGGVQLKYRKCNSPKPSLNGRDCSGPDRKVARKIWCNVQSCPGAQNHRDRQCVARGYPADSHNFGGENDCKLHCYQKANTYMLVGTVDDGTHCNRDSGVCVLGVCQTMPKYFAPTKAPPTDSSGAAVGSYSEIPNEDVWENKIFVVPDGVTNVVITNNDYDNDKMFVGYETPDGSEGYNWGEDDWMNQWVDHYGLYETKYTTAGVSYEYKRLPRYSTITIKGPVYPDTGYHLAIFVQGKSRAKITWRYGMTA